MRRVDLTGPAIHFQTPDGAFDGVALFLTSTDEALGALWQRGWPLVPS